MPEQMTAVQALARVMGDVQAVRKGDRNTQQGFLFRGVDAVVNAVGPALRKHGVVVVALAALVAVAWCAPGPVAWAGVAALYPTAAAIARRLP